MRAFDDEVNHLARVAIDSYERGKKEEKDRSNASMAIVESDVESILRTLQSIDCMNIPRWNPRMPTAGDGIWTDTEILADLRRQWDEHLQKVGEFFSRVRGSVGVAASSAKQILGREERLPF